MVSGVVIIFFVLVILCFFMAAVNFLLLLIMFCILVKLFSNIILWVFLMGCQESSLLFCRFIIVLMICLLLSIMMLVLCGWLIGLFFSVNVQIVFLFGGSREILVKWVLGLKFVEVLIILMVCLILFVVSVLSG